MAARCEAAFQSIIPLHPCCLLPPDANPNCVGTSSTNATYMPAWEAPQGSLAEAMDAFAAALREVAPEAVVVESSSSPTAEFRRFAVRDQLFERDDIE